MKLITEENSIISGNFIARIVTGNYITNTSLSLYVMGVIQVLLLTYFFALSPILLVTQIAIFSIVYWLSVRHYSIHFRFGLNMHFWQVAILGGLGMLVGHIIFGDASHGHHGGHQMIESSGTLDVIYRSIFGGMTLIMLVVCVPSCIVLCRQYTAHKTWLEAFIFHSVYSASMVLGMCLAPLCLSWFLEEKHIVLEYYFMCVLMAMFSAFAYYQILKYQSLKKISYLQSSSE